MRTPVQPGSPEEAARRRRRRLIVLALVAVAIVAGAVAAFVLLQPGPPMRILSVTVSPDPAIPDQPFTVTAQVQGGSFFAPVSVMATMNAFFTNPSGGGGSLFSRGGGTYSGTFGPFPNGTAVWLVITANSGGTTLVSPSYTVDVGTVTQGGASGLRLNTVVLNPPQPTSLDMPVVTANITSAATITDVSLSLMWFASGQYSGGSGLGAVAKAASGNYTTTPLYGWGGGPMGGGTAVGTLWLYRISAEDSSGNVLLSPVYSFTVASP